MTILKRFGKTLAVVLGAGLLVFVGAMFGLRTAHAVVASLVQVVNTAANPAITQDTSRQASQVVSLYCAEYPSLCNQILEGGGLASTAYAVPAGFHLIVTSADIFVATPFTGSGTQLYLQNTANGEPYEYFNIPSGSSGASYNFASGISVGSGTGLSINEVFLSSAGSVVFYLHGYLTAN
jgi:hypothetical protein